MSSQITNTVLMIRPIHFRMNEQTIVNNYYQSTANRVLDNAKALKEFDEMVKKLQSVGVQVIEFTPNDTLDTPDEVFPNNWISFHTPNIFVTYPMFAENRRFERRKAVLDTLSQLNLNFDKHVDFTYLEERNLYLEGTGSLVLDRINRMAYANISERMHEEALQMWCKEMNYTPIVFKAFQSVQGQRLPVYHTNVVMSIGTEWAICCLESIDHAESREEVRETLKANRELILIDERAMGHFAANILEVKNASGEKFIVMSKSAHNALGSRIVERLKAFAEPIICDLSFIESQGGGSARCMLAEVFVNSQSS